MRKGVKSLVLLVGLWPLAALGEHGAPFEYAAKIVCGVQKAEVAQSKSTLAPGFYNTTVNIHNPSAVEARIFKKVALTFPPGSEKPGRIVELGTHTLGPDVAFQADCPELMDRLQGSSATPLIEGFLIVQSTTSLDVTALYTVAGLKAPHPVSIDVEQIRERARP